MVAPAGRILVMEPAVDGEAQQLFHFFEDDTIALESAMAAIADSPLRVAQATQFEADWQVESKYEFSRYMFAYHDLAWNAQTEAGLFRQLGGKAADRPLVLYNLLVSIEWDATVSYTGQISRAARLASDYLTEQGNCQDALLSSH